MTTSIISIPDYFGTHADSPDVTAEVMANAVAFLPLVNDLLQICIDGGVVLEINPRATVEGIAKFYMPENAEEFFATPCDYIIDAIDTVTAKIDLIVRAQARGIRVISCMGAGNKMDPTRFEVADIYKTSVCPLAKVIRYELRSRGVKSLKVVYSKEKPLPPNAEMNSGQQPECICSSGPTRPGAARRQIPGSISFVPSVAGLILAGEVIKDLIGYRAGQ